MFLKAKIHTDNLTNSHHMYHEKDEYQVKGRSCPDTQARDGWLVPNTSPKPPTFAPLPASTFLLILLSIIIIIKRKQPHSHSRHHNLNSSTSSWQVDNSSVHHYHHQHQIINTILISPPPPPRHQLFSSFCFHNPCPPPNILFLPRLTSCIFWIGNLIGGQSWTSERVAKHC